MGYNLVCQVNFRWVKYRVPRLVVAPLCLARWTYRSQTAKYSANTNDRCRMGIIWSNQDWAAVTKGASWQDLRKCHEKRKNKKTLSALKSTAHVQLLWLAHFVKRECRWVARTRGPRMEVHTSIVLKIDLKSIVNWCYLRSVKEKRSAT